MRYGQQTSLRVGGPERDASAGGSKTDGTYSLGSARKRRIGLRPVGLARVLSWL